MYDNTPLEWDDVFQVWYDPDAPGTQVDLTEEEIEAVSERADIFYMHLAGIL